MGEKVFIVWYITEFGDEDYVTYHAETEDEARNKFHMYHDRIVIEVHEIDWNRQLVAD